MSNLAGAEFELQSFLTEEIKIIKIKNHGSSKLKINLFSTV